LIPISWIRRTYNRRYLECTATTLAHLYIRNCIPVSIQEHLLENTRTFSWMSPRFKCIPIKNNGNLFIQPELDSNKYSWHIRSKQIDTTLNGHCTVLFQHFKTENSAFMVSMECKRVNITYIKLNTWNSNLSYMTINIPKLVSVFNPSLILQAALILLYL
jgi:hypothetical protein